MSTVSPSTGSLPSHRTGIVATKPGGPEVLAPVKRDIVPPQEDEVLIKVHAAGVNRPDLLQRAGLYPPPKGADDVLGLEVAGTVVATGAAHRWRPGDRVCALVTGGGYADYCLADHGHCLPIPSNLDFIAAACLPETVFTVWANLVDRAGLCAGKSILVHGGSGGIGSTAIQIAKMMGATVFTTVGSPEKIEFCRSLGIEHAIDYKNRDFVDDIRAATRGKGVDIIFDMVGGDYIERNISLLARDGWLVNIAYQKGAKALINFLPVMLKRLTITGSTLRIRDAAFKTDLASRVYQNVWPWLENGSMVPKIDRVFPLAQAGDAHRYMESGRHMGKIALDVTAPSQAD